ncbi:MAG: hypothetical protein IJ814_07845 [Paludibacteraceae bacterium]|nr:hypothetical protein [Paludibacteraceae bacterium]
MTKTNKVIGIILAAALAIGAAAGVVWYSGMLASQETEKAAEPEAEPTVAEGQTRNGETMLNDHATHGAVYFAEEQAEADPMLVGKWRNTDNPQWYKVFYDDYDEEEELFWGKEWNEADDVAEEDLRYHGNGWFRWDTYGETLREFATMDSRDVPIAKIYVIDYLSPDSLSYHEDQSPKQVYQFTRP